MHSTDRPDHPARTRRRKRRRLVVALIAAPTIVIGALYAVGAYRLKAAAERARSFERLIDAREITRSVLWGDAVPGNAWDDYDAALDAIRTAITQPIPFATLRTPAARSERDAILARVGPALRRLRQGAHRTEVDRRIEWDAGFTGTVPSLLHVRDLANVAALEVDRLLEANRSVEAARVTLDALQFGRDLAATPRLFDRLIARAALDITLQARTTNLALFDEAGLAVLSAGLARLDTPSAFAPAAHALLGDAALMMRAVQTQGASALFVRSRWSVFGWRPTAASECVASVHEAGDAAGALDAVVDRPWPEVNAVVDRFNPRLHAWTNHSLLTPLVVHRRQAIADIRALRMAIQFLRGREVTALGDPFGDTLSFTVVDDTIAITYRSPGDPIPPRTLTVRRPARD